jgi:hypothetical protein
MIIIKTPKELHKPKYCAYFTEAEVKAMINTDWHNSNTFSGVFTELQCELIKLISNE